MMLTLDRNVKLSNLMIAFKNSDLMKYLRYLEQCKSFLSEDLYNFYYNLSLSKNFKRKDYYDR